MEAKLKAAVTQPDKILYAKVGLGNVNLAIFKIPSMVILRVTVLLKPSGQKLMKPACPFFRYPHYLTRILFTIGISTGSYVSATEISFIDDVNSEVSTNQMLSPLSESHFNWNHYDLEDESSSEADEFASLEETAYNQNYAEDYEKFRQGLESTGISEVELALDQSFSLYNVGGEELSVPIAKSEIYRVGQRGDFRRVSASRRNLPVNVNCDRGETRLWLCLELGW